MEIHWKLIAARTIPLLSEQQKKDFKKGMGNGNMER